MVPKCIYQVTPVTYVTLIIVGEAVGLKIVYFMMCNSSLKYKTNLNPSLAYNKIITLYTYKLGTRGLQLRRIWTRFIHSQTGLYHIVTCVYNIICTYAGLYRTWLMTTSYLYIYKMYVILCGPTSHGSLLPRYVYNTGSTNSVISTYFSSCRVSPSTRSADQTINCGDIAWN